MYIVWNCVTQFHIPYVLSNQLQYISDISEPEFVVVDKINQNTKPNVMYEVSIVSVAIRVHAIKESSKTNWSVNKI